MSGVCPAAIARSRRPRAISLGEPEGLCSPPLESVTTIEASPPCAAARAARPAGLDRCPRGERAKPRRIEHRGAAHAGEGLPAALSVAVRQSVKAISSAGMDDVRALLSNLSRDRALAGFSPAQTATFVFSLKQPCSSPCASSSPTTRGGSATSSGPRRPCSTSSACSPSRLPAHRKSSSSASSRSSSTFDTVVQLWDGILALLLSARSTAERTQT